MAPGKPGKRGPKRDPNKAVMRSTLIRDTAAQMDLLEASGHTHSEAYRIGSRLLTSTSEDLKKEEIKARLKENALAIRAAQAREAALLKQLEDMEAQEVQEALQSEALAQAVQDAARRLHKVKRDIRNGSPFRKVIMEGILELLPPGSIRFNELLEFLTADKRPPSYDQILEYIKEKVQSGKDGTPETTV